MDEATGILPGLPAVAGKPVHVATEDTDLTAELKRGLSFVRGG